MNTITYKPRIGEPLSMVIDNAVGLSKSAHCIVRFIFNGAILQATPKKSKTTILWEFIKHFYATGLR